MKKMLLIALSFLLSLPAHSADAPLKAVASFSIIGDVVKIIGGDEVALTTIIGPDTDAHAFEPTPSDAKSLADADIVFINGLGFEGWIERLAAEKKITVLSKEIKALSSHDDHGHDHDHKGSDPHAWQDVSNMRNYVASIAATLSSLRPAKSQYFVDRAAQYDLELQKLDRDIHTAIQSVPSEKRKIITSHDAFGYFENAYGITIIAAEGLGAHASPSASGVARLLDQIKKEQIKTVFLENLSDPKLITRIATDTGATLGGTLYTDALSAAGGPADTYIKMMRHNLSLMLTAMGTK
ncbi:MAG: metal ABC transporter substrate-binding protein [Proteobacteria bacterium]|nr:metal ABC transporter substrate-binding protein [Pseudomonadota bacterium]